MLGIGDEISIFLQALLAGNIVLLVYTCIRVCICLSRSMTLVMVVYVGSLP